MSIIQPKSAVLYIFLNVVLESRTYFERFTCIVPPLADNVRGVTPSEREHPSSTKALTP